MACPFCGGRLLSKTSDRPPRLICADCGALQPQAAPKPLLGLLDRQAPGLLLVGLLVLVPLSLLALSPWVRPTVPPAPEREKHRSAERQHKRWDPRTGVVGRPAAAHRQRD